MKIVIDTNVFIASFLSARGSPRRIIDLWKRGKITWCLCAEILEEYSAVLARFGMTETPEFERLRELFKARWNIAWAVIDGALETVPADPDDDKFVECALEAGADFILSGDIHLKAIGVFRGIPILSPAEFLRTFDA